MAGVAERKLRRALGTARRIGLDTSVLIYHLEDVRPYSEFTTYLLSEAEVRGVQLVLSVITLAEVLAGPWRVGDRVRAEGLHTNLKGIPGVVFAGIDEETATRAAELRGRANLPLPDALIIASAVDEEVTLMITNDTGWRGKALPCRLLILDDLMR